MILLPVSEGGKHVYDIAFEKGLSALPQLFSEAVPDLSRVLIVTDSRVSGLYLEEVLRAFESLGVRASSYIFPEGEENKNLDTVKGIYRKLAEERFQRSDCLVALGGGVTGDITGFAAATYLRGVRFVQIPTTVLACCDSSIGGKTGVDLDGYKNYVGAFYMPSLVYMNMDFLKSLDDRQYSAGLAEAVKSALIRDPSLYEKMREQSDRLIQRDTAFLTEVIKQSCLIKRTVVQEDPREKGIRAILNFGHTLGHAVEKLMGFEMLHGECVSVGSVAASYISMKRGLISESEHSDICGLLSGLGLPVCLPEGLDPAEVTSLAHSDKKAAGSRIRFILLDGIGNGVIDLSVTDEEMISALGAMKGSDS